MSKYMLKISIPLIFFVITFAFPWYAPARADRMTCNGKDVKSLDELFVSAPKSKIGQCFYFMPAQQVKSVDSTKLIHIFKSGAVFVDFGADKTTPFMGNVVVTGTFDYVTATGKTELIPVVMIADAPIYLMADKSILKNPNEGAKAAKDFEDFLISAAPQSKYLISFIDVSAKDGHLIIWIKESMFKADKNRQNDVYASILKMWRDTVFVREKKYGSWAEIKYQDTMTGESRTIRKIE